MRVVAEMTLVPLGEGVSLSGRVAEVLCLIRESGLPYQFHAMGTNVEGEWDEVVALLKRCTQHLVDQGVPRVSVAVKLSVRTDKVETLTSKTAAVESILAKRGTETQSP